MKVFREPQSIVCVVWYLDGQRHEYNRQIRPIRVRPSQGRKERWRERTPLGKPECVALLHRIDHRSVENLSDIIPPLKICPDFLKLSTYLVFFIVIMTFYGIPLNIVRDVYITGRSFVSRLRAMHRYQTATRNMDQRYPNATEAELHAMTDRTCIICREEMALPAPRPPDQPNAVEGPNTTPKKLPCGHIFHFYCLRSWLERQQSCPTWFVTVTLVLL